MVKTKCFEMFILSVNYVCKLYGKPFNFDFSFEKVLQYLNTNNVIQCNLTLLVKFWFTFYTDAKTQFD